MRTVRLAALTAFAAASACAAAPIADSALNGTCADQDRRCRRSPGDASFCDDQFAACEAEREAVIEERSAKQRGFDEFLREREAGE